MNRNPLVSGSEVLELNPSIKKRIPENTEAEEILCPNKIMRIPQKKDEVENIL
jgi:hypothetical protein